MLLGEHGPNRIHILTDIGRVDYSILFYFKLLYTQKEYDLHRVYIIN